ncbi:RNA exonuclease 1 homolog [Adelges cooleyi]|uniref:RNA exonuclease 1 homolog n=1 Tax=Adelges cooleyi TaxID=133065 RepID=UPI00217F6553|nr:RNA exonuclease 1 homolog [Adelges cooleyi]
MLPSKGYFKALECPYYNLSFCDRPYCHFKHSKQDYLSDNDLHHAASTDITNLKSSNNTKPSDESVIKQKTKSKIIEYVPKCIKPKNLENINSIIKKETNPVPEYVPSPVNGTTSNFKEYVDIQNDSNMDEKMSVEYTKPVSESYNINKQSLDITEYIPSSIVKTKNPKEVSGNKDNHKHHSSSKRKHTSSRSPSRSSSKSKKSKRDKSTDNIKTKKREHSKDERRRKDKIQDKNDVLFDNTKKFVGPKSLKEAVLQKVNKTLEDTINARKVSSSSIENNDALTSSVKSDLEDLFHSDISDISETEQNEEKCNIIEAKTKKRIAHISSNSIFSKINAKPVARPRSTKSLHEMVASRIQMTQNNKINELSSLAIKSKPPFLNNDLITPVLKTKNRIAHQPKLELSSTGETSSSSEKSKLPNANIKPNLRVKTFKSSNNMPNPMRQSCLEKLYAAFVKYYTSEEAIKNAYTTEEEVHNKAKTSGIYRNLIVQSLLKANKPPELQNKINPNYPSHMHGVCLYGLLKKYVLSKEDLEQNGYPLMGNNKLAYISKNAHYYRPISKKRNGDKFICMNCRNEFMVDKHGMPTLTLNKCIYHSGKLRFERSKNEKFWMCCYKRQHESGCESSIYHMPDKLDDDALEEFVSTEGVECKKNSEEPNFYALDCEMVNTTVGTEMVRVTVIDHEGNEVYESKIKPFNPILDYKSKYSGITEESLKYCSKRLFEVQLDLLKMFNRDSILIGHSLENDLKALKIVHYNVVDTSIMYPHKYGPPYKWSLKLLSEQYLQRIIQSEEGHDSKEDAVASLDLVWKRLKEDVKKFKPVNIISVNKK